MLSVTNKNWSCFDQDRLKVYAIKKDYICGYFHQTDSYPDI